MEKAQRHSPAEIWHITYELFRQELRLLYLQIEGGKPILQDHEGVIVDTGTPHNPALLLRPDGSIKFVQYGWSAPPDRDLEITNQDYCILATEIIENFTT